MADLAIGQICNSSCIMCTTIRTKDRPAKQFMVPKDEIFETIDNLEDPQYIAITGGEPTIRKDLIEIVDYIVKRFPDCEKKLLTNGRMLAYGKMTDNLVKSGINTFIIPLHAHDAGLHDFITRSEGSFNQTIKGLKNLVKYGGIRVEIRVVIHGINYPFLPEIAKLIRQQFKGVGVVFLYFDIIGSAFLNKEELVVPLNRVTPYLDEAVKILDGFDVGIYHFPLCTLEKDIRKAAKGKTVEDRRITFLEQCKECRSKDDCSGIWKTYSKLVDEKEFEPIR